MSSLKSCAKAEKKFEAWIGNPKLPAEKKFQQAFRDVHAKMKEQGTPILRHAQQMIGNG